MGKVHFIEDFLHRVKDPVKIEPDKDYKLVTVRLHHKGVALREIKKGAALGSNMFRIKSGQFILSGIDARNGAFGIVPDELDGAIITNDFWCFDIDENIVKRDFFYWLTNTPLFLDACIKSSAGITQRIRLQNDKFRKFELRLPPLREQLNFLNKISKYEFSTSSLKCEMDKQEFYLKQLRQAILQEAIEGKLTAEWRASTALSFRKSGKEVNGDPDYDAVALLEKVRGKRQEWIKISKLKGYSEASVIERKLSKLEDINNNDRLPDGWIWVRVIDAVNLIVDCHNKTAPYTSSGVKLIRTTNIRDRKLDLVDTKYVSEKTYQYWSKRCIPESNDIIFTREAPVGEAAIIPEGVQVCMGQRLMLIRPFHDLINNNYLLMVLTEPNFMIRLSEVQKGAFVKHLRVGDVENAIIALPPLAEQQAIVDRVGSLLAMVDVLDKQVNERKVLAEELMQSVLREAFG